MPAHLSLAEQEREWRKTSRTAELGLAAISERGRMKMCDTARKQRDSRSDVKPTTLEQTRKACALLNIKYAQMNINKQNENNTESNALKVDERLRLARERREAYQKQLVLRERSWLARQERAKQFYEKHLEERRKKLEEQRQREERRRMAVEEKRKQKLKEEKERYEFVVKKTMEKIQKVKQKPGHCSRKVTKNENNNAKRRCLSQWEIDLVRRLQTPTVSYLARSRSAVCLSRDTAVHICRRSASCHTMNSSTKRKPQVHSVKMQNRPASASPSVPIRRITKRELVAKGDSEGQDLKKPQLQTTTNEIKPKQDTNPPENSVLPTSWLQNRSHVRQATLKQDSLPPLPEEVDLESEETLAQCLQDNQLQSNPATNGPPNPLAGSQICNGPCQIGQVKLTAWTTDPEEATRLLTEKRRQARLQREKEIEERRLKEEIERKSREELVRRRAEEQARQEAEALRLEEEEKRKREEEEQLKAEEENAHRQKEEENRLQQQRELEARQRVLAEQQRLERESRFQKEEAERQERKKRLEEIMKRTRKTDSDNKKTASVKDNLPCENAKALIRLPGPGNTPKLELRDEEDMLPTVAFKERRSFRSLSGLDEIQAHQQTEVI
ncbi:ensconsin-like [Garra rufa]|uniref:ensconsin-like n=1 Tax=Garra rufa TaxID=137080 RepID=UPI003CCE7F11